MDAKQMTPSLVASEPVSPSWPEDTIVAISTAIGAGAIGIVRLSGPDAIPLAGAVFRPQRSAPLGAEETYSLLYGHVVDPDTSEMIDEGLMAVMRKPRSYTREDVVELHCHGGVAAQRSVLRLLIRSGARSAEPGEFTRRAFHNGRIDLAQAESVAAIVAARSTAALRASVRQLNGGLSERLQATRRCLIGLLAQIEATVDFSDEDVEELDWESLGGQLSSVESDLGRLLDTAFVGRALSQGVRTAIVGKPNVGKSSLLNALLMRERAIVSDIPGTTRDTVEELVEIGGIPIQLVDTAGLRSSGDHVERLGVSRSVEAMEQADLILVVVDLAAGWDEADRRLLSGLDPRRSIVIGNKADLVEDAQALLCDLAECLGLLSRERLNDEHGKACGKTGLSLEAGWRIVAVSALTGHGLEDLRLLIQETAAEGHEFCLDEPILANERHRALVQESFEWTGSAIAGVARRAGEELVCEDLRSAVGALGRITGEELTPDLLDEIFSRFCLGK